MVRLKPQWSDSSKPGNDRNGYIRGYKGVDREDNSEWFRTADRAADDFMYGKAVRNRRPDGAQRIMTGASDPGTITNDDKNYRGADE